MMANEQHPRAKRFRLERQKRGFTQVTLSQCTGLTQGLISGYETGQKFPRLSSVERLARALGAKPAQIYAWLLEDAQSPKEAA
jgi:transcriptional regulator with XRE-family HTH domain